MKESQAGRQTDRNKESLSEEETVRWIEGESDGEIV